MLAGAECEEATHMRIWFLRAVPLSRASVFLLVSISAELSETRGFCFFAFPGLSPYPAQPGMVKGIIQGTVHRRNTLKTCGK
jgi:hypothetical protein